MNQSNGNEKMPEAPKVDTKYLILHPDEITPEFFLGWEKGLEFLNNLPLNLQRKNEFLSSNDPRTNGDCLRDILKEEGWAEDKIDREFSQYSSIYLKQTQKQFGETIETVLKQLNFDYDNFLALKKRRGDISMYIFEKARSDSKATLADFKKETDESDEIERKLKIMLLPVYQAFRKLGYNHYPELIG